MARSRVENSSNGEAEVSISNGDITWKALPAKKIWCKQEIAQMTDLDSNEETGRNLLPAKICSAKHNTRL